MTPSVNVVYFPGTNCQRETIRAFAAVGAAARQVFISDVLRGRDRIDNADVLCIPGGFAFGDHVRSGVIAGAILSVELKDQLDSCRTRPILCICNGFQIGVRAGLFGDCLTLSVNAQGTFLNRPHQRHRVPRDPGTPWLRGLEGATLTFPCAHAEGNLRYLSRDGWKPALFYPPDENPDGAMDDIAGIASPDGRIFGLMNHPERAICREENLQIFRNAVTWG